MEIGKKYGRYEIRAKIGSGGMGEVYSAFDEELNRNVALKILNSEFSVDENKKNRFRREARAASALNHPNIITIYEIGEQDDNLFIATELIDGKTLRELIRHPPLHLLPTLKIATQIADALVAAHSAHIVHRDIKPENVMIRHDGYAKVLDFGLAKPIFESKENLSTDEILTTTPGMVIGSVRYMSPEQARGVKIDERTDIWSLGVVLYEMLLGKAPFDGATTSDTLANVIYQEPKSILETIPNVPPELDQILNKSLKKELGERYQSAKEFSTDLHNLLAKVEHEISFESQKRVDFSISENPTMLHQTVSANHPTKVLENTSNQIGNASNSTTSRSSYKKGFIGLLALIALIALGFGAYRWFVNSSNSSFKPFEKTEISRLSSDGKVRLPAISPDGKYIAYVSGDVGNRSLVVRQIATNSLVTVVPATTLDFQTVTFSPDGNHIFYTQSGKDFSINILYQIPTLGGTPKKIIEDVDSLPTFSPDGKRFAFLRHASKDGIDLIFTANLDGSDWKEVFTNKQTTFDYVGKPVWSPQGDKIILSAGNSVGGVGRGSVLLEFSLSDNTFRQLSDKKWKVINEIIWLKSGTELLFTAREKEESPSQIWQIAYPSGEVKQITNDLNDYFNLSISSDNSTISVIKSDMLFGIWSYSTATKTATQIIPDGNSFNGQNGVIQTPDEKLIYTRRDGKDTHLWMVDKDGKNPRQLTSEASDDFFPVVSPDGKYIVFGSNRSGTTRIWRIDIDGKNPKQLTQENSANGDFNHFITSDSKSVIFNTAFDGDKQPSTLQKISIDGGEASTVYAKEGFSIYDPQLSLDNKMIVFSAYNQKTFEKRLYLAEFDGNQVKKEIGNLEYNLANQFTWSPDGKSLTYWSVDGVPNVWKVSLDGKEKQQITNFTSGRISNYAWSNDGKKLLIVRPIVNNDLVLIKDVK